MTDLPLKGRPDVLVCSQGVCDTSVVNHLNELAANYTFPSQQVWCSSVSTYFDLNCTNETASVSFTCPAAYDSAVCQYWVAGTRPGELGYWSTEGCVLASYDEETGSASCNCSHLTDFAAQASEEFGDSFSTFGDTLSTASDLTLADVSRNAGLLYLLSSLWIASIGLFVRDTLHANRERVTYLCAIFKSEDFRRIFDVLPVTAPARALIAARSGSKALVPSAVPAPMLVRKPKKSAKTPIKFVMESVRFSRKGRQESLALSMKNISDNEMIPSDLKSVVDESKGIVDQYVPDGHSCRCYGMFASTRLALIRWWTALRQENELVSFFDCAAWVDSEGSSQRGIAFLAKVITMLFLCCLAAPNAYLCPDDGSGAGSLGVSPPMVSSEDLDVEAFVKGYVSNISETIIDFIFVTFWTFPVVILLFFVYDFGSRIEKSDRQAKERYGLRGDNIVPNPIEI